MCIKKKQKILLLLGAGFSVPAGFPSAFMLSNNIKAQIYDHIRNSFKEGNDELLQSYILEKVLIDSDQCDGFDYERYFDFLQEEKNNKLDKDKLLSFLERGMYGYFWKCSRGSDCERPEKKSQLNSMFDALVLKSEDYHSIVEGVEQWYQHIIAQSLAISSNIFNPCYKGFVDVLSYYVKHEYIVNIYTLNHDLFLENLLSLTNLKDKVSNGFRDEQEIICGKKYSNFDIKNFNTPIRIYKLHGGIDIYKLCYFESTDVHFIQILDGYDAKNSFFINSEKNVGISPMFLTGKTSKEKQYCQEPYRSLLNDFKMQVDEASKLITIGYSGNDNGINDIIYKQYQHWDNAYVIDPNATGHPFVLEKHAKYKNVGVESLTLPLVGK